MSRHRHKKTPKDRQRQRLVDFADRLRRNMTLAERDLYSVLQCWKRPWNVHAQYPLAGFIVDFAWPDHRIAVELDGASHNSEESKAYDRCRTAALMSKGWKVFRFRDEEVFADQQKVAEAIRTLVTGHPDRCLCVPFKAWEE